MTEVLTETRPDVDLADGRFYADGEPARPTLDARPRTGVPDRNGRAAAATYEAVLDAERNPELFSNAGGIRPDSRACRT